MQTSRHPAGTEGRSDVKATRVGIDIHNFACKVEARYQLTFKGFRIDFLETDSTLGNKGLCKGHFSSYRNFKFFNGLDKLFSFLFSQLFDFFRISLYKNSAKRSGNKVFKAFFKDFSRFSSRNVTKSFSES